MIEAKLLCMMIAAHLTNAARAGVATGVTAPPDPTLQDPNQRAIDLETWEIFRAFHNGVVSAVNDDASWPSPTAPAGGKNVPAALANALQVPAVQAAITGNPALAVLAAALQGVGLLASTAAQVPLPNPGTPK